MGYCRLLGVFFWIISILALGACGPSELTDAGSLLRTPREQYERTLKREHGAFIADRFHATARAALLDSLHISLPYEERGTVDTFTMRAASYLIDLEWGQALDLHWGGSGPRLLVELNPADRLGESIYQAAATDTSALIPVPATGTYLLHVQPEWRRGGAYHLRVRRTGAVGFPVAGKGNADIWSKWGDPRDGGKRKHEGIDIFARRGTPVVAVTAGRVRLRNGGLGGKTVWLGDAEGRNWYYAHLDSQYVATGDYVSEGDTLGAVGNTGNARRTKPHLHFGLYRRGRGATDPLPFVQHYRRRFPRLLAAADRTNRRARTVRRTVSLLNAPTRKAGVKMRLPGSSVLLVLGASGDYFRVRTLDGTVGYVARGSIGRAV